MREIKTYELHEIAERLKLSIRTVRGYASRGKLKSVKIGTKYIVSEENYRKFINGETS